MMQLRESAWVRLLRDGSLAGHYDVGVPDGSRLRILYGAIANILPGQHLIAFAPADRPEDELTTTEDPGANPLPGSLSGQREVLSLVAAGANSRQTPDELTISPATVNTHVRSALRTLGARNRAHEIALAMLLGLIDLPPSMRDDGETPEPGIPPTYGLRAAVAVTWNEMDPRQSRSARRHRAATGILAFLTRAVLAVQVNG